MKKDILALVYVDYEGLKLLEMGDEEFVLNKFAEYVLNINNFNEKYKDYCYPFPDEYYDNPLSEINNIKNLCIRGYNEEDKIVCLCKKYI